MRYRLSFRDLNEKTANASRFHREAFKLKKHLLDFKPELVDLKGSIVTLPRHGGFATYLRLHLPTGTITAEGRGYTRVGAWHDVVKELEVRIERHKARLFRGRSRDRRRRDEQRWSDLVFERKSNGHSVQASIQAGYSDLLDFVATEIRLHEKKGNLPKGFVEPVELTDVVAMVVLKDVHAKPADLSYEHWFLKVAYEQVLETIDEARQSRLRGRNGPTIDTILPRPEGPEGLTEEEDLVNEWIEPDPRRRFGYDIPDPRSLS